MKYRDIWDDTVYPAILISVAVSNLIILALKIPTPQAAILSIMAGFFNIAYCMRFKLPFWVFWTAGLISIIPLCMAILGGVFRDIVYATLLTGTLFYSATKQED